MLKKSRYLPIIFIISLIILGGFGLLESATSEWWDTNYQYRKKITVSIGANSPSGGYNGYTIRVANFDTAALVAIGKMRSDCNDLRIAYWNGSTWTEADRHVIDCNTTATDVRLKLQADISASSTDDNYYIYYGYSLAGAPTALGTTNVYLWYDDAASDRSTSYTFGRCDPWHGAGYTAWSYDAINDYYTVDTGDNYTGCFRRAVNERDAYIEVEMYHIGCYLSNMTSGVIGRYILGSGSGGTEDANHYYASNRAHQASCGSGYSHDGDIMESSRGTLGIDGTDPSAIAINQWRKQALATWRINNTNGKFWDSDTLSGFGPAGWPTVTPNASGTDSTDQEGAGDWGVMAAQDIVRARNILIRRYTEPEPITLLDIEEENGGVPPPPPPPSNNVWGWAWAGGDDLTPNNPEAGNGWISFNCTDRGVCGSSNYAVSIGEIDIETEIGEFSGYAWAGGGEEAGADAPTLGWISFNRSETGDPPQDDPGAGSGPIAVLDYNTKQIRGWMRVLANGDGWDGWIKLGDSIGTWPFGGDQVKIIDTAAPHVKEFGGWAWGGDVVGWISFSCVNQGTCTGDGGYDYWVEADINFPPEVIDLDYYFLYCTDSLHPYLTWTYSDFDPEDFQAVYQVQIVSPLKLDTGEVYSNSGEYQVKVADMVILGDDLEWNTTYSWRVKVRDNYGAWSVWSSPSTFTTPTHPYPDVDFTWSPKRPSALESISFFDDSTCYDDNIEGSPCSHPNTGGNDSFFWDFDAGGLGYPVNWDWDTGDARYLEFPVVSFSYPSNWQIKLEITDSHGIPFTCSETKSIKVSYPLPDWKEVIPR